VYHLQEQKSLVRNQYFVIVNGIFYEEMLNIHVLRQKKDISGIDWDTDVGGDFSVLILDVNRKSSVYLRQFVALRKSSFLNDASCQIINFCVWIMQFVILLLHLHFNWKKIDFEFQIILNSNIEKWWCI